MSQPRVAVLLAAYNGLQWISEQIESIRNQKNADVTIFISVDKSTDQTYQWCKQQEQQTSRIKVLPYGERFGGAGKNFYRLIKEVDFSNFDYVALADQDDIWLEDKLYEAIYILNEKSCDAYSSDVIAFWESGKQEKIVKSQPQKQFDYLFEAAGPGCTYVLKASPFLAFKKFLLTNEQAAEFKLHDWLIYAWYRSSGYKWVISDSPKMLYRQHESNQVGYNKGWKAYVSRVKQVKNKHYRKEVEKLVSFLILPKRFKMKRPFLIINFQRLRRRTRDTVILLGFNILGLF